jgi:hypothetical protein
VSDPAGDVRLGGGRDERDLGLWPLPPMSDDNRDRRAGGGAMWLIGLSLVLAALVAVLLGLRFWFNRMQDVRTPRDDDAEQRNRAVTSSTIYTSGSGRF